MNDNCVRFLLLVLYQFLSSFWCLIELVCHSDWYLLCVHRSEKYIIVDCFFLALLNLSGSCSECRRKIFFFLCTLHLCVQWNKGYLMHISSLMTFFTIHRGSHNCTKGKNLKGVCDFVSI